MVVVVAAVLALSEWCASEFAHRDDQHLVRQPPVFEVGDLRACLEYEMEEMGTFPGYLEPLEQSIIELFKSPRRGGTLIITRPATLGAVISFIIGTTAFTVIAVPVIAVIFFLIIFSCVTGISSINVTKSAKFA